MSLTDMDIKVQAARENRAKFLYSKVGEGFEEVCKAIYKADYVAAMNHNQFVNMLGSILANPDVSLEGRLGAFRMCQMKSGHEFQYDIYDQESLVYAYLELIKRHSGVERYEAMRAELFGDIEDHVEDERIEEIMEEEFINVVVVAEKEIVNSPMVDGVLPDDVKLAIVVDHTYDYFVFDAYGHMFFEHINACDRDTVRMYYDWMKSGIGVHEDLQLYMMNRKIPIGKVLITYHIGFIPDGYKYMGTFTHRSGEIDMMRNIVEMLAYRLGDRCGSIDAGMCWLRRYNRKYWGMLKYFGMPFMSQYELDLIDVATGLVQKRGFGNREVEKNGVLHVSDPFVREICVHCGCNERFHTQILCQGARCALEYCMICQFACEFCGCLPTPPPSQIDHDIVFMQLQRKLYDSGVLVGFDMQDYEIGGWQDLFFFISSGLVPEKLKASTIARLYLIKPMVLSDYGLNMFIGATEYEVKAGRSNLKSLDVLAIILKRFLPCFSGVSIAGVKVHIRNIDRDRINGYKFSYVDLYNMGGVPFDDIAIIGKYF